MQSVKTSQGMAIDTAECSHTFRLPEVKLIHILEANEEKGSANEVKVSGGFLLGGEGRRPLPAAARWLWIWFFGFRRVGLGRDFGVNVHQAFLISHGQGM